MSKKDKSVDGKNISSWTMFAALTLSGVFILFFTPAEMYTFWHKLTGIILLDLAIFGAGKSMDEKDNTSYFSDIALGIMFFFITLELVYVFPIRNGILNLLIEVILLTFSGFGVTKGALAFQRSKAKFSIFHVVPSSTLPESNLAQKHQLNFDSIVNLGSFITSVIALIFQIVQG